MKCVLDFLTERQKEIVKKEITEEGYCVLQAWTNKQREKDYRVLRDTVIIMPHRIIDRIKWVFKRVIK